MFIVLNWEWDLVWSGATSTHKEIQNYLQYLTLNSSGVEWIIF